MSLLTEIKKQQIAEAALFAAGKPLSTKELLKFFPREDNLTLKELKKILVTLETSYVDKGINLKEVASGFRFQINTEIFPYLSSLYEEKPARYSKALMETLALIAYKQPITRGEIEDVRGVGVSTNIIHTLLEHEWIKAVGHREVPGRPTLYATTNRFLDYFNLKSLAELPELSELKDLETIAREFEQKELQFNEAINAEVHDGNGSNGDEDEEDDDDEDEDYDDHHESYEEGDDEQSDEEDDDEFSEDFENENSHSVQVQLKRDAFEEVVMVVVEDATDEVTPAVNERKKLIKNLKVKQKKQSD